MFPTRLFANRFYAAVYWERPPQTVSLIGIASSEAFGTLRLNQQFALTGIASSEAFGVLKFNMQINLTGITTEQGFGTLIFLHGGIGPVVVLPGRVTTWVIR